MLIYFPMISVNCQRDGNFGQLHMFICHRHTLGSECRPCNICYTHGGECRHCKICYTWEWVQTAICYTHEYTNIYSCSRTFVGSFQSIIDLFWVLKCNQHSCIYEYCWFVWAELDMIQHCMLFELVLFTFKKWIIIAWIIYLFILEATLIPTANSRSFCFTY